MPSGPANLDPALHRQLGVDLFNRVWALLEIDECTPEEADELVHAAHASAYHWRQVGKPENFARSEWQCSRVYAVLGRPEQAVRHARRCLELCEQHGMDDWDLGFAYEAVARAQAQAETDAEADDRELLLRDLSTITPPSG